MYTVQKLNEKNRWNDSQWVVMLTNFDGVARPFGYFENKDFADITAEALNSTAAVQLASN